MTAVKLTNKLSRITIHQVVAYLEICLVLSVFHIHVTFLSSLSLIRAMCISAFGSLVVNKVSLGGHMESYSKIYISSFLRL